MDSVVCHFSLGEPTFRLARDAYLRLATHSPPTHARCNSINALTIERPRAVTATRITRQPAELRGRGRGRGRGKTRERARRPVITFRSLPRTQAATTEREREREREKASTIRSATSGELRSRPGRFHASFYLCAAARSKSAHVAAPALGLNKLSVIAVAAYKLAASSFKQMAGRLHTRARAALHFESVALIYEGGRHIYTRLY